MADAVEADTEEMQKIAPQITMMIDQVAMANVLAHLQPPDQPTPQKLAGNDILTGNFATVAGMEGVEVNTENGSAMQASILRPEARTEGEMPVGMDIGTNTFAQEEGEQTLSVKASAAAHAEPEAVENTSAKMGQIQPQTTSPLSATAAQMQENIAASGKVQGFDGSAKSSRRPVTVEGVDVEVSASEALPSRDGRTTDTFRGELPVSADGRPAGADKTRKVEIRADRRAEADSDAGKGRAEEAVGSTTVDTEAERPVAARAGHQTIQTGIQITDLSSRPGIGHTQFAMSANLQVDSAAAIARMADIPASQSAASPMGQVLPVIVTMAAQSEAGTQSTVVRMDPEHLGKIEVRVHREKEDSRSQISIVAERPETLLLLQKDYSQLVRALERIGLDAHENAEFQLASGFSSPDDRDSQQADTELYAEARNGRRGNGTETSVIEHTAPKTVRWLHTGLNITA